MPAASAPGIPFPNAAQCCKEDQNQDRIDKYTVKMMSPLPKQFRRLTAPRKRSPVPTKPQAFFRLTAKAA